MKFIFIRMKGKKKNFLALQRKLLISSDLTVDLLLTKRVLIQICNCSITLFFKLHVIFSVISCLDICHLRNDIAMDKKECFFAFLFICSCSNGIVSAHYKKCLVFILHFQAIAVFSCEVIYKYNLYNTLIEHKRISNLTQETH